MKLQGAKSTLKNNYYTLSPFNGTALKTDTLPQASNRRDRGKRQEGAGYEVLRDKNRLRKKLQTP